MSFRNSFFMSSCDFHEKVVQPSSRVSECPVETIMYEPLPLRHSGKSRRAVNVCGRNFSNLSLLVSVKKRNVRGKVLPAVVQHRRRVRRRGPRLGPLFVLDDPERRRRRVGRRRVLAEVLLAARGWRVGWQPAQDPGLGVQLLELLRNRVSPVECDSDGLHHLELGLAVARVGRRLDVAAAAGEAADEQLPDPPTRLLALVQQQLSAVGQRVQGRVGDQQDVAQLLEDPGPG